MQPKQNIIHLPVYQPGKPVEEVQRELGLAEVTKLASNENPFGCSPKAKQAIIDMVDESSIYPDGASVTLTAKLADLLQVEPNQIIFGAGSDDVILMICRAYLVAGDETIMADRTFPQYKHNAQIENAVCIEVPLNDGKHDLPAMLSKVTDRTKIVWICNPNNPTSTIVTHDELKSFMEQVPSDVLVVLDEAYYEYVTSEDFPDGLSLLESYKNIVLLRTFSKAYGLAALRIGYGIGHPEVIHTINQVREPFNTTRFAQVAALAALDDQEFLRSCQTQNAAGLAYFRTEFDRLNLPYFEAHGNFILVDTQRDAEQVYNGLLRKGYIIRGGHTASIGFPTYIRVTVGSETQNKGFIAALEEVLAQLATVSV